MLRLRGLRRRRGLWAQRRMSFIPFASEPCRFIAGVAFARILSPFFLPSSSFLIFFFAGVVTRLCSELEAIEDAAGLSVSE